MTMEPEKSSNLLSASWKPREADSVIQSGSKGLRMCRGNDVTPSLGAAEEEMRCPGSVSVAGKTQANSPFLGLLGFCSTQALSGLDDAHPHWRG